MVAEKCMQSNYEKKNLVSLFPTEDLGYEFLRISQNFHFFMFPTQHSGHVIQNDQENVSNPLRFSIRALEKYTVFRRIAFLSNDTKN